MEIGKKKVTKDGTVVDLWGMYGKRFTNGHKTFTSSEVKAVIELQHNEELFRSNFEKYQKNMVRPRDPLAGDATPRNPNGEPIMNVRLLRADKGTTGHLLLPDNRLPAKEWIPPVNVTGQIGKCIYLLSLLLLCIKIILVVTNSIVISATLVIRHLTYIYPFPPRHS